MHTDMYQLTMCYSYFSENRHKYHSCFEMFYRENPFKGTHVVFAGLREALVFIKDFSFSEEDIDYLKLILGEKEEGFWEYLR